MIAILKGWKTKRGEIWWSQSDKLTPPPPKFPRNVREVKTWNNYEFLFWKGGSSFLNMTNWVRYHPPPPSEPFRLREHAKRRCDTPPTKGVSQWYLRDTIWKQDRKGAIHSLRYYLERVLRDLGGYLALGRQGFQLDEMFFQETTPKCRKLILMHKACFGRLDERASKKRKPQEKKKKLTLNQEWRRGAFSKGGFCRVQCHSQGNKKSLGPAVHVALRAPQPREECILAKKPPLKTPDWSQSAFDTILKAFPQGQQRYPKVLVWQRDLAELSGELSGAVASKPLIFTGYCPQVVQNILWRSSCDFLALVLLGGVFWFSWRVVCF